MLTAALITEFGRLDDGDAEFLVTVFTPLPFIISVQNVWHARTARLRVEDEAGGIVDDRLGDKIRLHALPGFRSNISSNVINVFGFRPAQTRKIWDVFGIITSWCKYKT